MKTFQLSAAQGEVNIRRINRADLPQDLTNVAPEMGLRDLKLGGPSLFGCSDRDTFTRTFTATAANGQRVKGVVCKGWLKGATIRITGRA